MGGTRSSVASIRSLPSRQEDVSIRGKRYQVDSALFEMTKLGTPILTGEARQFGYVTEAEMLDSIRGREGLFRGISGRELSFIRQSGFIESTGEAEGDQALGFTYFSPSSEYALEYGRNNASRGVSYLLEVDPSSVKTSQVADRDQIEVSGRVPASGIRDVWEIRLGTRVQTRGNSYQAGVLAYRRLPKKEYR